METGMTRLRIGILGGGMIATISYGYLPHLGKIGDRIEVVAIANRGIDKAKRVADRYSIPAAVSSLDELLRLDLDAVVNLTPGPIHFETSKAILASGRHLVTEKPLASTLAEADELIALADHRGVLIVSAPADVLASEWSLARDLVGAGAIGKVAFARVQSSHAGPAGLGWPVDPRGFYKRGVGPLLDMGVYGLHQVTSVLGPARRVVAMSGITEPTRLVRGGPFHGLEVAVEESDNNLLLLDFGASTFAVVDATFDVVASRSPRMEVFGLEGTLIVNRADANSPPVELYRLEAAPGVGGWITPHEYGFPSAADRFKDLQRGVLIEHLADCVRDAMKPIASAEHARHVLEIMIAARISASRGEAVELATTF
jgi:predicted dehydrogenase